MAELVAKWSRWGRRYDRNAGGGVARRGVGQVVALVYWRRDRPWDFGVSCYFDADELERSVWVSVGWASFTVSVSLARWWERQRREFARDRSAESGDS